MSEHTVSAGFIGLASPLPQLTVVFPLIGEISLTAAKNPNFEPSTVPHDRAQLVFCHTSDDIILISQLITEQNMHSDAVFCFCDDSEVCAQCAHFRLTD